MTTKYVRLVIPSRIHLLKDKTQAAYFTLCGRRLEIGQVYVYEFERVPDNFCKACDRAKASVAMIEGG